MKRIASFLGYFCLVGLGHAATVEFSVVPVHSAPATPTSINHQGLVAGYYENGGFLYDATGFRPVQPKARLLGEESAVPWEPGVTFPYTLQQVQWNGVNDAGQLVGSAVLSNKWSPVSPGVDRARYPIVWDGVSADATAVNLHDGAAVSLNAAGMAVGSGAGVAFRLGPGTNLTIFTNQELTRAAGINGDGTIVGTRQLDAVTYFNGVTTVLPVMESGGQSWLFASSANGINAAGQVIGNLSYTSPVGFGSWTRGFLWSNGSRVFLEMLNASSSEAHGINNSGVVVGRVLFPDGTSRAFVYRQGQMVDLNTLIPVSGWVLTDATAINDLGQIVGTGLLEGEPRGFLLSPLDPGGPVPPSIVLQPVGGNVKLGGTITLKVTANGTPPFTYQWIRGVDELPNGTEATLQLTDVNATASGTYRVRVHNAGGDAFSEPAVVTVLDPEVEVARYAGLTLNGAVGGQYKIEAASALLPDIWAPIAELTLTNASQLWFDLESGTNPIPRYYRAIRIRP
ncbi:MAG: immunoglobulin domain-containing protein [Verrucomicrobiota bacterium]